MTRLISGVLLAAAALAAILFLDPPVLRFVAAAVGLLAAREYLDIVVPRLPSRHIGTLFVVLVVLYLGSGPMGLNPYWWPLLALLTCVVGVLFRSESLADNAQVVFAALYIGMPLAMLVAIHALGGREAVLLLIATIVVSDSSQYYTGRMFGRRLLAPAVSPKKTVEGALGGVVIGTAFMVYVGAFVLPMARPAMLFAMGLCTVLLGIAGDLFESKLKRVAGVKDSSAMIPGHGGVLDRIDALLLATPAFYLFLHEVM